MQLALQLRIASIFEILIVSFIGFGFPLLASIRNFAHSKQCELCSANANDNEIISSLDAGNILESDGFRLAKAFSAGVILSVALLHLLNDAIATIGLVHGYNLPLALLCAGIVLTLGLEQLSLYSLIKLSRLEPMKVSSEERRDEILKIPNSAIMELSNTVEEESFSSERSKQYLNAPDLQSVKALVKATVLEASVAVHSIIIGFDLGTMGTPSDVPTIRVLMVALAFHQFFEGISLGTAISETKLSTTTKIGFAFIFSFTLPVGIILGLLTQTSSIGEFIKGCANAIASGSLVYTSLVEMVADDFGNESLREKHSLRFQMLISFALGCLSMALLAVWS